MERIERLPNQVNGVVMLMTPDMQYTRREKDYATSIENVIFEYGYMAARLTRRRVAICLFNGVTLPSDFAGMLVIQAGDYKNGELLELLEETIKTLRRWLEDLPSLADEMPPVQRVHGYSGQWRVRNRFSYWQGSPIQETEKISFEGDMFLAISVDGKKGYGYQTGELFVYLDDYEAQWTIVNRISNAMVDGDGMLTLYPEVLARTRDDKQNAVLPKGRFRDSLIGSRQFKITLEIAPGEHKKLHGVHEYLFNSELYNKAWEVHEYRGFFDLT